MTTRDGLVHRVRAAANTATKGARLFILAACVAAIACAKPVLSDVKLDSTVGVDSAGDPDFGYELSASITNEGERGDVMVTYVLSTNQGQWQSAQTISLDRGEKRKISFAFLQPTILAKINSYEIRTIP